jgi:hypothetical protein
MSSSKNNWKSVSFEILFVKSGLSLTKTLYICNMILIKILPKNSRTTFDKCN